MHLDAKTGPKIFETTPGRVYELRVLLQRDDRDCDVADLSICEVDLTFYNDEGRHLDPELVCDQPLIPELRVTTVEVLPPCELNDAIVAGGLASRFLVAPPDATRLHVELRNDDVTCRRIELSALNVLWSTDQAVYLRNEARQACNKRHMLLERHLQLTVASNTALETMRRVPERQIDQIMERFAPKGDWQPVLAAMADPAERDDYWLRMDRLRAQTKQLPRIGFIGSERGYERLCGMSKILWLREAEYADQLSLLDLDLILIETTPNSGASAQDMNWNLAFSSLDGSLPERGAVFLEATRAQGIPVHLWVTNVPALAKLWRGCAAAVARVIVEGGDGDWSDFDCGHHTVPHATEPAACSPASLRERDPDLMLIPTASDIFQYPDFSKIITEGMPFQPLLTEFHYRFVRHALGDRLGNQYVHCVGEHNRAHQRVLMQAAAMVLLPAHSLRTDQELATLAMDAIISGAIPVLFGEPRSDLPLLNMIAQVFSATDVMELQALYRVHWFRERHWRRLMRFVMRNHTWNSTNRMALLGYDPFPKSFDQPRISAILVTKRPHLLRDCLNSFRRQSWHNKELIIVLNIDKMPDSLPKLRKNERIYFLHETANIGECLNRGIAQSTGRYWAKIDDDDFYSFTYLEETVYYYRAAQADVVGRQSAYFFFAAPGETSFRSNVFSRCNKIHKKGHLSGATLSADKVNVSEPFSSKDRNGADSNWIGMLISSGRRAFSTDATSIIVYRDKDEAKHTWRLGNVTEQFSTCASFNIFGVLEGGL